MNNETLKLAYELGFRMALGPKLAGVFQLAPGGVLRRAGVQTVKKPLLSPEMLAKMRQQQAAMARGSASMAATQGQIPAQVVGGQFLPPNARVLRQFAPPYPQANMPVPMAG